MLIRSSAIGSGTYCTTVKKECMGRLKTLYGERGDGRDQLLAAPGEVACHLDTLVHRKNPFLKRRGHGTADRCHIIHFGQHGASVFDLGSRQAAASDDRRIW